MNNESKILKNIEYYEEIVREIVKTEEYDEFKKNYKEHKLLKKDISIIDAYITKASYEFLKFINKDLNSSTTTFAKDREALYRTGSYLDLLEVLKERINLNNVTTSKKDPVFKYKANNPFFVSYNQIKKEFDMNENKKNTELEVCCKNMYWLNKTIKTVRGLRFGRQDQYSKENKLNGKFFGNILYNCYNSQEIRNVDIKILDEYYKYLENKIEYSKFSENKYFKILKDKINTNMKKNASLKGKIPEIDTNFLMEDLAMSNLLNKLYVGKIYYIEKSMESIDKENILKRNKIKVGIIKQNKKKKKNKHKTLFCIIIPKYAMPFEVRIDDMYLKRDLGKFDLDFTNKIRTKMPYKKTINYKISKEQEEKLEEVTENFEILNKPAKELVSFTNKMLKGKTKEVLAYYKDESKEEKVC